MGHIARQCSLSGEDEVKISLRGQRDEKEYGRAVESTSGLV